MPDNATPFDIDDLKACSRCGKGVMHDGSLVFYELKIQPCVVDMNSARQMHGLEMMLGAAAPLARVFAPSSTIAHRVGDPARHLLCLDCASTSRLPPLAYLEDGEAEDGKEAQRG